ncbi:N-acetyltransferase [Sphingopyxis indica]|uniref:GNAT family N-acetyltransferase n=1 Tax=Sphingopyxis indica TaxID=436663 RepID=UPI00293921AA|nr:GNAT family N-acetyltransferase [Sphingopyxis indica]WOF43073.1 N-acetyltransferase [Sphingopyxis indica]
MTELSITKEHIEGRYWRYLGRIDGIDGAAEIVYTQRGPDLISADHTEATESMKGTGAAAALVVYMVEDARKHGFKIMPLCPYVFAQYQKHPEWADVMTIAPGEDQSALFG